MKARPVSMLPLQVLLYFDYYYSLIYLVLGLIIYIDKAATLKYPANTLAPEVVGLILMVITQFCRIKIGNTQSGSAANKAESVSSALWFFILGIPCIIIAIFYLLFQTFV